MNSLKNIYYKSAAVLTVGMLATSKAKAAEDLTEVTGSMTKAVDSAIQLISVVSYVAAMGFGIAGVMKLKEYMDKPGSVPLAQPLGRILIGALLVALPALLSAVVGSTTGENGSLSNGKYNFSG